MCAENLFVCKVFVKYVCMFTPVFTVCDLNFCYQKLVLYNYNNLKYSMNIKSKRRMDLFYFFLLPPLISVYYRLSENVQTSVICHCCVQMKSNIFGSLMIKMILIKSLTEY